MCHCDQNILKPGAEGKLLVPNMKLKASSASSSHPNDSASVSSWHPGSTHSYMQSPLSQHASEVSVESSSDLTDAIPDQNELPYSLPTSKWPMVESVLSSHSHLSLGFNTVSTAYSWSYNNMTTYPVMPMPPRKEICYERRVVNDGCRDRGRSPTTTEALVSVSWEGTALNTLLLPHILAFICQPRVATCCIHMTVVRYLLST